MIYEMKRITLNQQVTLSKEKIIKKFTSFFRKINISDKRILMVCEDITRSTPVHLFAKDLFQFLIKKENKITILFALGTHRPMTKKEMMKKLRITQELAQKIKLVNHNAYNDLNLIEIGRIDSVPIKLNHLVAENDFLIGIGSVIPHRVMGFSGGAKIICPGNCR